MKFNPFCMCCAVSKQEQKIRSFQDMDKKVEYMKKAWTVWHLSTRKTVLPVSPLN